MAKNLIKKKILKSPRPYVLGSYFDSRFETRMCILRLGFDYLEKNDLEVEKVLKKCKENIHMSIDDVYRVSDLEGVIFPKSYTPNKENTKEQWKNVVEKLYYDLLDARYDHLANFIYEYHHNNREHPLKKKQ